MVLRWNGEVAADIPLAPLADDAPSYDRPWVRTEPPAPLTGIPESTDSAPYFRELVASSWRTSAMAVAAFSPIPILGTATRAR